MHVIMNGSMWLGGGGGGGGPQLLPEGCHGGVGGGGGGAAGPHPQGYTVKKTGPRGVRFEGCYSPRSVMATH